MAAGDRREKWNQGFVKKAESVTRDGSLAEYTVILMAKIWEIIIKQLGFWIQLAAYVLGRQSGFKGKFEKNKLFNNLISKISFGKTYFPK